MTETNPKTAVIGTGLNGLVGSRIVQDLQSQIAFENVDINHPTDPVDITNQEQLDRFFERSKALVVIHCAAFTDVTAAWQQTNDTDGLAFRINVTGTKHVAEACQKFGKHLLHLSTAYVFDGTNPEPYSELDQPNPIEWYGKTKLLAEEAVQACGDNWTILRIDQPFRSDSHFKLDVAHKIIQRLSDSTLPPQFTDHTFGPTFIDDLSRVMQWFISTKTPGLFHASSGEQWDDFAFASTIASMLPNTPTVQPGSLQKYLESSERPYQANTALSVEKLKATSGITLTSIRSALQQTVETALSTQQ